MQLAGSEHCSRYRTSLLLTLRSRLEGVAQMLLLRPDLRALGAARRYYPSGESLSEKGYTSRAKCIYLSFETYIPIA